MILGNWTAAGWPGNTEVTPKPPPPKPVDLKKRFCGPVEACLYTTRPPKVPQFTTKETTNG